MPEPLASEAQNIIERHKKLKADKEPWNSTYQTIGKYVMTRKQNFTQDISPGQFLTGEVFDSTASNANHLLASSMIGALWPNGAKTFTIDPPSSVKIDETDTEDMKIWFEKVTQIMTNVMDDPKAGFATALEEYMIDQGAFGISGIGVFENEESEHIPIEFIAVDAKKIAIAEGKDGFVDTVYIEKQLTVRQLVQEYGEPNPILGDGVSTTMWESYQNGDLERKVKVLHAIEPRNDVKGGFGDPDKPIGSIHIEMDTAHVLRKSGYYEMPVFVTRFWKTMGEVYGRSPAMETMPDIIEANVLREAAIIATEKMLDPPLWVTDDGTLGGGTIDTSAGAINVRRVSGRMADLNHKPIEQIITIAEMQSTFKRIAELREIISNNFFIDRLLDLNNEQRMTLGEANIRNELRGQSLGTIYSRQIAELFTRVIERVFRILLGRGMLGVLENSKEYHLAILNGQTPFVIPNAIADLMLNDKDAFKVTFISPAARIMRNEELLGIQRTVGFAADIARVNPEALDVIDTDQVMKDVAELTGAPARIIRTADDIKNIRQQRAQQQQAAAQMEAQKVQAEVMKLTSQGAAYQAKAGAGGAGGGIQLAA